jgi:two-component system sensor histidine kinase PilS (NtrC family)
MGADASRDLSASLRLSAAGIEATVPSRFSISHWRSLRFFNAYRVAVALLMVLAAAFSGDASFLGAADRAAFFSLSFGYVLFGLFCFVPARLRRPDLDWQLTVQVTGDIVFIVAMMHLSGGIVSGVGLLLLAVLAGAGLISRGRLTLFYASLASIAVLLQHTYQVLASDAVGSQFIQAGFLSTGFFATAWVAHVLASYTVQSERLAAQREVDLANMAEVNQLVIRDMDTGVVVIDAEGRIRSRNAKAESLLGPFDSDQMENTLRNRAPALAGRIARWREKSAADREPATTLIAGKPVAVRFVPVGRDGSVGAVLFLEDLTRVQAQARQMKLASLGRLTANIAHEIRNPLSAISHATELLQEEAGFDETAARLLSIIHDNTQRLDRMVQDVLKLNRRDRAHTEHFCVADFLRTFVQQFCSIERIDPQVLRLEIALQTGIETMVAFDRSHLNQVMWNLCRNALRYCRGLPGSIVVRVDRGAGADRVRLSVIDDGPGIAAQHRVHLFEPFFTTVATGTGLGLYIAREVCEANGASLDYVESAAAGHFCVECRRVEPV